MQKAKSYQNLILGCCMTGIVMLFAFFFLYHTYIQNIIYEERLNQMEEITRQMFQNLEDVIDSNWNRVTEECNYLKDAKGKELPELNIGLLYDWYSDASCILFSVSYLYPGYYL